MIRLIRDAGRRTLVGPIAQRRRRAARALLIGLSCFAVSCGTTPTDPVTTANGADSLGGRDASDTGEALRRWTGVLLFEGPDARVASCDLASLQRRTIDVGRSPSMVSSDEIVLIDSTGRYLTIGSVGGAKRVLVDGGVDRALFDARVAPDGGRVAVTHLAAGAQRPRTLVVDLEGVLLATVDDAASPTWLPDGRLVVAGWFRWPYSDDAPEMPAGEDGLFIADSALTRLARLAIDVTGAMYPAVSPDGGRIAFALDGDIWTVNTNGERLRQITSGASRESYPAWSPDAQHIACVVIEHDSATADGAVAIVPANLPEPTAITTASAIWPRASSPEPKSLILCAGSLSWQ